jgi:Ca-activated chloride channel family protein
VILVVDTSGSMEGEKIARTRDALQAFVGQIRGERDRVSLVEFASNIKDFVPLQTLDDANRQALLYRIGALNEGGGTALIDATYAAADYLLEQEDSEAINAIVVMTDGQENESQLGMEEIQQLLSATATPPVIFTIGFGGDADEDVLSALAAIGGGQFRRASETDIEELYKIISTYF